MHTMSLWRGAVLSFALTLPLVAPALAHDGLGPDVGLTRLPGSVYFSEYPNNPSSWYPAGLAAHSTRNPGATVYYREFPNDPASWYPAGLAKHSSRNPGATVYYREFPQNPVAWYSGLDGYVSAQQPNGTMQR